MFLEKERNDVVDTCQRLVPEGLVKGTSGNVSCRVGDFVAISPSTIDYDQLTAEDICVVDLSGKVVEGRHAPSSELPMHLAIYNSDSEKLAIVHSHSPFASVLSTLVDELPAIHYMIVTLGGAIRVTDYHRFGSDELAVDVVRSLSDRSAVILGSHGGLVVGDSLKNALKRGVTLEWLCALYYRAKLFGDPRIMSEGELELAREAMFRKSYGLHEEEK